MQKCQVIFARALKQFYTLRSSIVHGRGVPQKGKLKKSLVVSTKIRFLPIPKLKELADLSLRIIEATINEPKLISLIQSDNKESKITEDLSPFYTQKLLSR